MLILFWKGEVMGEGVDFFNRCESGVFFFFFLVFPPNVGSYNLRGCYYLRKYMVCDIIIVSKGSHSVWGNLNCNNILK